MYTHRGARLSLIVDGLSGARVQATLKTPTKCGAWHGITLDQLQVLMSACNLPRDGETRLKVGEVCVEHICCGIPPNTFKVDRLAKELLKQVVRVPLHTPSDLHMSVRILSA
jgi:hypothetical protein